mmetsp:Transcript_145578/g.363072  ORF Transcript_145578/g.363072 Transcript_145578/m.363072 type:complete len:462 (-) Transcript_145578:275-1660(-)
METYRAMTEKLDDLESCTEDSICSSEDFSQYIQETPRTIVKETDVPKLSEKPAFHYAVGAVIMLNTIVISLEAALVQHREMQTCFAFAEFIFTVVYVGEIAIRLREIGTNAFFCGPDWGWNLFDFTITATGVADTILAYVGVAGVGASAARLFRVLRILRLFRAFRFLSEIDYVIHTAGRAVLKLALLVVLVVFVSAIVTTNILWDVPDADVASMYSNLGNSMWTMFKLMTLENWIGTVERTVSAKPGIFPFFLCFIFVASIAIMSLVPAIFIELNLSDREKAEKMRVEKEKEDLYKSKERALKHFFKLIDRDRSGKVSISEMAHFLQHDRKIRELQAAGKATESDLRDMKLGLFDLWDTKLEECGNKNIELTEAEFFNGVLQSWGVVDEKTLWRSITATRRQLRELIGLAKRQQVQLERQQAVLDHLSQFHRSPRCPIGSDSHPAFSHLATKMEEGSQSA